MGEEGIPKDVLNELEHNIQGKLLSEGRLVVEKHQITIKLPVIIKHELELPLGSKKVPIIYDLKKQQLIIELNEKKTTT